MKIRIRTAGPYMNKFGNVATMQPGEILDTKDWYAMSLIESGYAETIPQAGTHTSAVTVAGEQTVEVSEGPDPEQAAPEEKAQPPFSELPGMTDAIIAELETRGIVHTVAFVDALASGALKDLHVSVRTYNGWKKALGLKG